DKSSQNPCQIWNFCLFSKPYLKDLFERKKDNKEELEKIQNKIMQDDYLKYLIEAIQHVSTVNVVEKSEEEFKEEFEEKVGVFQ
ncbi:hypothetical protein, partial [Heyndrickxia coagulans]|uniref:hypothetical protein n=1 Tax=Heyndrickxia coagulans TaxID=1398 RepID=UPI000B182D7E